MHPGGPAVWGKAFQAALTARDAPGYGNLLGAFHSEVGLLNRGTLENIDINQRAKRQIFT